MALRRGVRVRRCGPGPGPSVRHLRGGSRASAGPLASWRPVDTLLRRCLGPMRPPPYAHVGIAFAALSTSLWVGWLLVVLGSVCRAGLAGSRDRPCCPAAPAGLEDGIHARAGWGAPPAEPAVVGREAGGSRVREDGWAAGGQGARGCGRRSTLVVYCGGPVAARQASGATGRAPESLVSVVLGGVV